MRRHTTGSLTGLPITNRAFALAVVLVGLSAFGPFAASAPALPAPPLGRGYELVSHADMAGNFPQMPVLFANGIHNPVNPAAPNGERLLFSGYPAAGVPVSAHLPTAYVAQRHAHGWSQEYAGAPGNRIDLSQTAHMSPTLSVVLSSVAAVPDKVLGGRLLSVDTDDDRDLYARHEDGTFSWASPRPPSWKDVARDESAIYGMADGGTAWTYVSRDLETGKESPFLVPTAEGGEAVSILPGGPVTMTDGTLLTSEGAPLSPDGDRVVFVSPGMDPSHPKQIWVRLRGEERTVLASGKEPGVVGPDLPAVLDTFSGDGSAVFFTTAQRLTTTDTDGQVDLYRFDIDTEDTEMISAAAPGAPSDGQAETCTPAYDASDCEVSPVAYSADGKTSYFLSPEPLDEGAIANAPNFYIRRAGETRLVATLAAGDPFEKEVGVVTWRSTSPVDRPVRVSEDGERIAFESRAQLTSYDNEGQAEIYFYDADVHHIVCASCATTPALGSNTEAKLSAAGAAEIRPMEGKPFVQGRNLANGASQVYFQTAERLVARDINHVMDVYEYDVASETTTLISSGSGSEGSYYLDNSTDGEDVFFFSTETLVPPEQDRNGAVWKLFDARRGGGFPAAAADPECASECRGSVTGPPALPAAGTALAVGNGNFKARQRKRKRCAKGKGRVKTRQGRVRCASKGRSKGNAKRTANSDRRVSR